MKAKLIAIANWLRILDEDGMLSITNLGAIALIVKVMLGPTDWTGVAALLVALGGYHFKRYQAQQKQTAALVLAANAKAAEAQQPLELAAIKADITRLKIAMGITNGIND